MIRESVRYIFILLCLFLVFWFIYPTKYVYTLYDYDRPAKIDRFTGEGWVWHLARGWEPVHFNKTLEEKN